MARLIFGIISIIGTPAYGMTVFSLCRSHPFAVAEFRAAFIGFIIGAGVWLILGRKLGFFSVFEHELTHLVFSLLMFQKPSSFYASEKRGHVSCDRGNFVDGLAPYFFPTFSYLLLSLYPVLKPAAHSFFFPFLGFLSGYHIVSNVGEFRPRESDIRRYGILFSFVFSLFAGIVAFGFLLAFSIGGPGGGLRFLGAGLAQAGENLQYVATALRDLISHAITYLGVTQW